MLRFTRREWLASVLSGLAGCAALAVRPPTPANDIPLEDVPAEPGCRYFGSVFASQGTPKRPKQSHSFATIIRVCNADCNAGLDHHTISWLPQTLDIRVLARDTEPGRNLGLVETVEWALKNDQEVTQWGPYEVRPRVYRRFLVQKEFLESGVVGYQCIDTFGEARTGKGCNCIHAITDMDPRFPRIGYPLFRFGVDASRHMVRQLVQAGTIFDVERLHPELNEPLGIAHFPIRQEKIEG